MKNKIKQLKKEIEYWNEIEKKIDDCSKEDYEGFTKLEQLWINCPIDILRAKLQAFQEAQKIQDEKIKKLKDILNMNGELTEIQIDKIFGGGK